MRGAIGAGFCSLLMATAAGANEATNRNLRDLTSELANAPLDLELRLNVAQALLAADQPLQAASVLESAPVSLEVVLLRAKALLWGKSPERAERVLKAAPEEIQRSLDVRILLAEVLDALGKLASAKSTIDAVVLEFGTHAEAKVIQARLRKRLLASPNVPTLDRIAAAAEWRSVSSGPEDQGAAEALLTEALPRLPREERAAGVKAVESRWPQDSKRERLLLTVESRWEDFPAAFERARAIVSRDPTSEDVRAALGDLACGAAWSLLGNKNPEGARHVALSLKPTERPSCLLLALGHSSMAVADFPGAAAAFGALSKREPKNKDAWLGSAQAAMGGNDFQKAEVAIVAFERLPDADRKQANAMRVDMYVRGANKALQGHQPLDGERLSRKALALDARSIEGALLLASALQIQGRDDAAALTLTGAIEQNPKSPRLLSALARVPGERDHAALAKRAIALLKTEPAEAKFDVQLGLGDALVLDDKLDQAAVEYRNFARLQPDSQAPKLRLAQVSMRQGNFFLAHEQVEAALEQERSFGAVLSLADASHALNLEGDAFRLARTALEIEPGQPDAVRFLDRLEFSHAPAASARLMHSWDNGTNQAWEYGVNSSTDLDPDLRATADASLRSVVNQGTGESANVVGVRLGLAHQWTSRVAVSAAVGVAQFRSDLAADGIAPWGMARTDLRIGIAHRLALEYQADTFSYTAGMADDHLGLHTLAAISYGPVIPWVSYYTNLSVAELTDGNERGLVFASLYSDLVNQPVVKTGLNGQILGFSETSVRSYFSPSQLVNTEAFAEILADNVDDVLIYGALAAGGVQWIEDRSSQKTYRFNARLGVRPWRSLKIVALGQTSSSASSNIAGFDYYELGVTTQITLY